MDCNEARRLLNADVDGELDIVRHLELEAHLRSCPECAHVAENARARRHALRENLPRFTAPAGLAERIRDALPADRQLAGAKAERASAHRAGVLGRPKIIFPLWQVSGLAASVLVALFFGYALGTTRAHREFLVADAIADHVRSLQADHLTDVASTDQHTVKPWFAGKIDFAPPVVDLASNGFPLVGGRLEQLDGHITAALVFRRRQHAINLFVWRSQGANINAHADGQNGYNTHSWSRAGLNFLAVSEIPADELTQFADAFRGATK